MNAEALVRAIAVLTQAAGRGASVDAMVRELCAATISAIDVDGAGVALIEGGSDRFVHATTSAAASLEMIQHTLRTSPNRDAVRTGLGVIVPDLSQQPQWPEYTATARDLGYRAVAALPMTGRGRTWGCLNLYRATPTEWARIDIEAASALAGIASSYIVTASDLQTTDALEDRLVHQALHDDLTGLPNRELLFDRIEQALVSSRSRRSTMALIFVDLDRFKAINDTFGHANGDVVLREVADRLSHQLRATDTLGRLAGDEFVWICQDLPGAGAGRLDQSIKAITSRIQRTLTAPIQLDGADVSISASIGVAITTDQVSARELLSDADLAMYAAKQRGHGTTVVRDHTRPGASGHARQFERDLMHALERRQLAVYFQPIVSSGRPSRPAAVEALLRWHHPSGYVLPAAAFIDLAINNGQISMIGQWVIEQTCGQLRRWNDQVGVGAPRIAYVNLSTRELADPELPAIIDRALERHQLQPGQVGLEVVEDAFADDGTVERLRGYRTRGHPLSIDDFGTGYSSLSRLVDLSVDYVKIDRQLVEGAPGDDRCTGVIEAVLRVADELGMHVIAEGVETDEQREYLTAAGCAFLQGYLIGPPEPAASHEPRHLPAA